MATRSRNTPGPRKKPAPALQPRRRIAVIGAGMAGISCARTLVQAGHDVTVFEKSSGASGRMASRDTPFGSFDTGAQYFTVRDPRFQQALATTPQAARPWSANAVRVLDEQGQLSSPSLAHPEAHWVGAPAMNQLVRAWAAPLLAAGRLHLNTQVTALERDRLDAERWQLHCDGSGPTQGVQAGFDTVLLALPAPQAAALLAPLSAATELTAAAQQTRTAPCWTLMLAFPQAEQPGLITLGPQWNVARSTHHRIAWLARESSKPGRSQVERWTVQASDVWSTEHLNDDPARVQAKLLRAFVDVTGIRAEPAHQDVKLWRYAKTLQPLGQTHVWDPANGLGLCGDWCLGHRVEDAFVSGLSLALNLA
ncbi:FAD-dependent oxidoreductase [Curvibacter sp. HBC61]|uniref:FAD-dependent oxidoreductase n=1 Tax=Curvibacter cyanobacteriorum TaxID=3026422 RepID=A0ABT5MTL6_9BURK|nr:FAD-dependent oxidoreductase [Curvibacter sp. HBC61]MDD0837376.1 FAD-dependent oxidoreductase [Curvibacter sp. HBC61]